MSDKKRKGLPLVDPKPKVEKTVPTRAKKGTTKPTPRSKITAAVAAPAEARASEAAAAETGLVFPQTMEVIPRDTQVAVAGVFESLDERGQHFAAEGIDFAPTMVLAGISNLYLNKKYGTNCYMYGSNSSIRHFLHGGFRIDVLSDPLPPITPFFLEDFIEKNLNQIKIFLDCLKNNNPVIIIPLSLHFLSGGHHANMLFFKRRDETLEHFEPHGQSLSRNPRNGEIITRILQTLVDKINEVKKKPVYSIPGLGDIRLVPSHQVCVRASGLQSVQEELKGFGIERGQYCQMWSFLFAELALLNPDTSSKNILDEIFRLLDTKYGPQFLSNVIRGYVSVLGDGISEFLSEFINNVLTIENMSYIFSIDEKYAHYLSLMLEYVITCEFNVKLIFRAMAPPITMASLEANELRLKQTLSNYIRIQEELKNLLINRKRNYLLQGKERVDAEIYAKLQQELAEYDRYKESTQKYIQNKIFKNFLRSQQSSMAASAVKSSRKGGKKYKKTRKYKKPRKYKKTRKIKR